MVTFLFPLLLCLLAQATISSPLLVPRTLTIMEPTTGPLITHHRGVLSFISQQLKDRQRRLCAGDGTPAVRLWPPGGASFPEAPERGVAGRRAFRRRGPCPCSLSKQGLKRESQGHQRAPGQGPHAPFRPRALGGTTFP